MRHEITTKLATVPLLCALMLSNQLLWSQQVEDTSPEKVCRTFWSLISTVPTVQGAIVAERTNYSANANFAKRSATLIQGTIGGRLTFKQFHHLPFEITVSDRKVEGNLFVFGFENEGELKKYLEQRPAEILGKRGILTAKAPQQFKVLVKGANLIVLVVDGARVDQIVDELFARVGRLSEPERP